MKAEICGTNQLIKSSMTQRCLPITLFLTASSLEKYSWLFVAISVREHFYIGLLGGSSAD